MYSFSKRLKLTEDLGVVRIKVFKVSNERPLPGGKLTNGDELFDKNDQGLLGVFNSKQKMAFVLAIEIERREDLHVVWTEGRDRQVKLLGDQTPDAGTAFFAKRIPTDKTLNGDFVTKSTDNLGNGVWVISTADGQLQMWEVAIVTLVTGGQSKCYLSLQKVYAGEMFTCTLEKGPNQWIDPIYISEDQFPGYAFWPSLRNFLSEKVDRSGLRPVSECQPSGSEPPQLASDLAEVLWFNQAKGFGFARVLNEEKDPIFHRTSVQDQEFPAFEPGQIIRFSSIIRTPRGAQLRGVKSGVKF